MARRAPARRRPPAPPRATVTTSQGTAELAPDPRDPAVRVLRIEGLEASAVDVADPARLPLDYLHRLGVALDVLLARGEPADVVHLGGGAFALPRFLAATRPLARQEVYELEPALVELARRELRLRRSPGLRVRVGDARELLSRRAAAGPPCDVVVGDVFVGTHVPEHLAGPDFAALVRRALRPGGAYLLNVVDVPPFAEAARARAVLGAAFAHVVAFGAREVVTRRRAGNLLLAASDAPLPRAALERALAGGPFPAIVR